MIHYEIKLTEDALSSLKELSDYICDTLQAPETAVSYVREIRQAISSLSEFPHRIRFVDEESFHSESLRKMTVKRFYVYFTVDDKNKIVNVLYIVYSRRDQLGFLSK